MTPIEQLNQKDFPPPKKWKELYGLTDEEAKEYEHLDKFSCLPGRVKVWEDQSRGHEKRRPNSN